MSDPITPPSGPTPILARIAAWKVAIAANPETAFSPEVAARAALPMVMGNPLFGVEGQPETVEVPAATFVQQVIEAGVAPAAVVASVAAALAAKAAPDQVGAESLQVANASPKL